MRAFIVSFVLLFSFSVSGQKSSKTTNNLSGKEFKKPVKIRSNNSYLVSKDYLASQTFLSPQGSVKNAAVYLKSDKRKKNLVYTNIEKIHSLQFNHYLAIKKQNRKNVMVLDFYINGYDRKNGAVSESIKLEIPQHIVSRLKDPILEKHSYLERGDLRQSDTGLVSFVESNTKWKVVGKVVYLDFTNRTLSNNVKLDDDLDSFYEGAKVIDEVKTSVEIKYLQDVLFGLGDRYFGIKEQINVFDIDNPVIELKIERKISGNNKALKFSEFQISWKKEKP